MFVSFETTSDTGIFPAPGVETVVEMDPASVSEADSGMIVVPNNKGPITAKFESSLTFPPAAASAPTAPASTPDPSQQKNEKNILSP